MASDFELGIQALRRGDCARAVEFLEPLCRASPGEYRARLALAVAYGDCDRALDAVRVLEDAIRLRPRVPQGHYNLAVALERSGRAPLAQAALRHTLLLHPTYLTARH